MKIYVASSWRNKYQPDLIKELKEHGYDVYDFRNPKEGDNGFHWSEIDPNWNNWTRQDYKEALNHPLATSGFESDYQAMLQCDIFIGVMPFGISASLEMGWAAGEEKITILYIPELIKPELMVNLFDYIVIDKEMLFEILVDISENKHLFIDTQ